MYRIETENSILELSPQEYEQELILENEID